MADSGTPPAAAGGQPTRGLTAEASSLAGSFGRHLQALAALAGFETRQAATLYIKLLAVGLVAALCALLGYLFLLLFIAFLVEACLHVRWFWIALAYALLHLGGAILGALYVRRNFQEPVFSATSAELKRDFEALSRFKP